MTLNRQRRVRVLLEHFRHLPKSIAGAWTERRRVEVEQNFVLHSDIQFARSCPRDVDSLNLTELAFLLVHHRPDDRARGGSGDCANHRAAFAAVMSAVVADHRAGDRTGDAADDRALFRFRVIIHRLCEEWHRREEHCQQSCNGLSHSCPP